METKVVSKEQLLVDRLRAAAPAERLAMATNRICELTAEVLKLPSVEPVPADKTFDELGFDSLLALEFAEVLGDQTGLTLIGTLVFEFPTPNHIADHILDELGLASSSVTNGAAQPARSPPADTVAADEPIAIVSMACRFPGGIRTPEELWSVISSGRGVAGGFPTDRGWSGTGKGGFLYDAANFDSEFFGIAPREATAMDPQQRLLLEVTWEAIERAGLDPSTLSGSDTGTFVGIVQNDYGTRFGIDAAQGPLLTGTAASVASGRIAYTLGLQGPTLSVDTACSSSLVALHLAAQALRSQECSLALVGGVTVMASPFVFTEFERQGGLAADGRCKAFADSADGTAWSEGVGVLLVERLSDARRNGHPIVGLLRGSAINSDGPSNGLTAPNVRAQERVIANALESAGLEAADVELIEAHGTGTKLGDPIEAQALLASYCSERALPLWLGSLKSNIGHTQAAAGVAGVMKAVLALQHETIPPTLHVEQPSSMVDWSRALRLAVEPQPWPRMERERYAAVSSFGISGTNAHVILQQAPATDSSRSQSVEPVVWPLSAKSSDALSEQCKRLHEWVTTRSDISIEDVAATLARRTEFSHRVAVVGHDRKGLLDSLSRAVRSGIGKSGVGSLAEREVSVAFAFSGQGAQRPRAGAGLYEASSIFRAAFDEVCAELDRHLEHPILPIAMAEPGSPAAVRLNDTAYTQPALFALQVAQFRLLTSLGVEPQYLIGHSVGEISAAHVAGVMSLTDACALVAARGRLMSDAMPTGAMVAVACSEADAGSMIVGHEDKVSVAAVNGPAAVVLSGDPDALKEIIEARIDGRRHTWLKVGRAFHSPHVAHIVDELSKIAVGFSYSKPSIPIVSNLTGDMASDTDISTPDYWVRHARQPVRFADGLHTLGKRGVGAFVEVGPGPVLSSMIAASFEAPLVLPLLRDGQDEYEGVVRTLAELWVRGASVSRPGVSVERGRVVPLPTYAFRRQRFWLESSHQPEDRVFEHPVLTSVRTRPDGGDVEFSGTLSTQTHSWLGDHQVMGSTIVAGAVLVDLALAAGAEVKAPVLDDLTIHDPLVLSDNEHTVRVSVGNEFSGRRSLTIRAAERDGVWKTFATGSVSKVGVATESSPRLRLWPPPGATEVDLSAASTLLKERGFYHGPSFQGLRAAWRRGDETFAEVAAPQGVDGTFRLHPVLLDSALQSLVSDGEGALPYEWSAVQIFEEALGSLRVRMIRTGDQEASVVFYGADGEPVASVARSALRRPSIGTPKFFREEWKRIDEDAAFTGTVAVVGEDELNISRDLGAAVEDLAQLDPVPDIVFVPLAADPTNPVGEAHRLTSRVLTLLQTWLGEPRYASSRLTFVTLSAVAAKEGQALEPAAAAVWGMVKSAQSEHPERFGLVDIDRSIDTRRVLGKLGAGLARAAIREGEVLVPRLRQLALVPDESVSSLNVDGTVLITGGTGALGAALARHLVHRRGVRQLVLASRSGSGSSRAEALITELSELGATARIVACDVSDRDSVRKLLSEFSKSTDRSSAEAPLTAVFHLAGALDDGVITSLNPTRLAAVLRPKVDAAWHLHELTHELGLADDLSAFVMFSSIAGTLGSPGQGSYAAANTFIDALARRRVDDGRPGLAIAWGPWLEVGGMADVATPEGIERFRKSGLGPMGAAEALDMLDRSMAQLEPVLVAADILNTDLLGEERQASTEAVVVGESGFAESIAAAPSAEREHLVLQTIRTEVASVLGYPSSDDVDPGQDLSDMGFDSLMSVEMRNRLAAVTGLRLSSTS
ncbi:MAG: type I polyketide synthase, partial [Myxococcota bacterium]